MSQKPFCSCEAGFTPQLWTVFLCIINIVLCWIRQCSGWIRAEPALNNHYSHYITDYRKRQSSLAAHSVWVSMWVISKLLRTSAKKVSWVSKGGGDNERKDEVRQHKLIHSFLREMGVVCAAVCSCEGGLGFEDWFCHLQTFSTSQEENVIFLSLVIWWRRR